MKSTSVLVSALAALSACVDFGYRLPPPPEEPDAQAADGGTDDGAGCVEGAVPPSTGGTQVALITLNVDRPVVSISAGDVVTWTNTDTMPHTVTAGAPGAPLPPAQGGFDSDTLAPGAKWAYRFCRARTVIYYCRTHEGQMNNYRVVVGS